MHIYLKGTGALLFSGLISLIFSCASVYFGDTAKSWWYCVYKVKFFGKYCYYNEKYTRRRYQPWFDSYTIYVGRLLKENLFFKENDISKPKTWFSTYYFFFTMVFDIIFYTLCIFLSLNVLFKYFLFGYAVLKFFIYICIIIYYPFLDSRYYKKEKEDWNIREEAIKKIKESNPHFFDPYDPILNEKNASASNFLIDDYCYK